MTKLALALAALTLTMGTARAALVDPGAFTPTAVIGFGTDADIGTANPSYTLGGVTVSFGGYFAGQTLDGGFPEAPVDAGVADGPLALAGTARILADNAFAGSPVLVGDTNDNTQYGPLAILFGTPMAAISLLAGYLDEPGGVTVVAYAATGTSLGSVVSTGTGLQSFRLAGSGGALISGLLVYPTVGAFEPAFGIDNVGFVLPAAPVPAPGGLVLLLPLAALAWLRWRAG